MQIGRENVGIFINRSILDDCFVTTLNAENLPIAAVQKIDFSKALKYYREAASSGALEDMKAFYLKRYALLSEKQGDVSSALDAYKEIKEKYGMTNDARDIEKYIARASAAKK